MRQLAALMLSVIILGVIYWRIDLRELLRVFQHVQLGWLALSLAVIGPLMVLSAWRLRYLVPRGVTLRLGDATRLVFTASTLNMVLPSKMGDLAKAYFLTGPGRLTGSLAFSLVVFEKACDVLALLLWCLIGLISSPHPTWVRAMTVPVALMLLGGLLLMSAPRLTGWCVTVARLMLPARASAPLERLQQSWEELHDSFRRRPLRLLLMAAMSVALWFLHLVQIWWLLPALNVHAPLGAHLALASLSILVGLLPLTIAGIGTRDSALIVLYQPFFAAPIAAALGLFCTLRYVIPALIGLPFLPRFLSSPHVVS